MGADRLGRIALQSKEQPLPRTTHTHTHTEADKEFGNL